MKKKKEITLAESEYLDYFFHAADFGPADGEIRKNIQNHFEEETGKKIPKRYKW